MSSHGSQEIASEKQAVSHEVKPAEPVIPAGKVKKEKVVHNAALFAAIQESNINPRSKESFELYFCIFIAFCCACANGYDGSLMTSIIAMKSFQKVFQTSDVGPKVSLIFSLYTVGAMIGAPFAAVLSDRFGRRKGMFCGGGVIILGMIVISTAMTVPQFVVGRFILGFGIAIMTVAAPAYAIEISPPHWRGRCTGFYNCGWFGGAIPAAIVTFGTNYLGEDNNYAWRVPLILQAAACVLVMATVFFLPESPRFLMANDREAEAIEFLVKYHGNKDPNSKLVQLEVEEMREGIKLDGIDKTWWDYRPLFLSHNGRWRMAQVLMISIFGQFSGNGLGYFNTAIFRELGVTEVPAQLGYNILNQCLSAIGALTAVSQTDRMPRRKVLVIGTALCAVALACNSGLSAALDNQQRSGGKIDLSYGRGALASYFLFNIIFSFTYTPLQGVIPTEALETTMRAKGLAASGFIVNAISFINQFATPIALENIKYKYIFVFVGWDLFEALMWYLFCVESQGRTLEQLEWVYDQPNPVKASLTVDKVILTDQGVQVAEKGTV
ncbi:putative transporter [Podospora australis]|uniref:Transporter n=1 Tax=Podospora australis TaxID=1536484 RepID=A0AAN7AN28_9PEZI|nr:putative transporter [Podospora australis]